MPLPCTNFNLRRCLLVPPTIRLSTAPPNTIESWTPRKKPRAPAWCFDTLNHDQRNNSTAEAAPRMPTYSCCSPSHVHRLLGS